MKKFLFAFIFILVISSMGHKTYVPFTENAEVYINPEQDEPIFPPVG